ncbi:MAG: MlaA family lipoprotein [Candidatus Gastranaerophilales bacterium]
MLKKHKKLIVIGVLLCLNFNTAHSEEIKENIHPNYSQMYLGNEKFEKFNRKMFALNLKANKYIARPIHTIWVSIMPQYGIDRIENVTKNIEYPIRLVSTLIQKDFDASKTETVRFLTNTTIGLGGLFDPAKSILKIEPVDENMEQALANCNIKSGPYIVLPVISSTTPRAIIGRTLDAGLNPSSYIATPIIAMVKAGLTVNKTSKTQSLIQTVEQNYADPYEIAKTAHGIERHIKQKNYDRKVVIEKVLEEQNKNKIENVNSDEIKLTNANNEKNEEQLLNINETLHGSANIDNITQLDYNLANTTLLPDKEIQDYNPQNPIVDAMRTALFQNPQHKSIWNERSIWNRNFNKKIKTASIKTEKNRAKYKFSYILQKDKTAPLAILYPSIGENHKSHHSIVLAKTLYDKGYSILMFGSHFHFDFINSMKVGYTPGIPTQDAKEVHKITQKSIEFLQQKYHNEFSNKIALGTSFGAMMTLFIANEEYQQKTIGIDKFISINPPIELVYAIKQIDKTNLKYDINSEETKEKVAIMCAKILQFINNPSNKTNDNTFKLPFNEEEGRLITSFLLHQKLSDLIYTIEKNSNKSTTEIYNQINNTNFYDYLEKYLLAKSQNSYKIINNDTSLFAIKDYLINNDNYKIYHTLDDYLVNKKLLKQLKICSNKKIILFENGSHLGYLYRKEFIDELNNDTDIGKIKQISHQFKLTQSSH